MIIMAQGEATISCSYRFEAAHQLPKVPLGHKCASMHGHTYRVDIKISGPVEDNGFVLDFGAIDLMMNCWLKQVDHKVLNHVPGLENPTAENIALWFATQFRNSLERSVTVRVYENPDMWAEVSL